MAKMVKDGAVGFRSVPQAQKRQLRKNRPGATMARWESVRMGRGNLEEGRWRSGDLGCVKSQGSTEVIQGHSWRSDGSFERLVTAQV